MSGPECPTLVKLVRKNHEITGEFLFRARAPKPFDDVGTASTKSARFGVLGLSHPNVQAPSPPPPPSIEVLHFNTLLVPGFLLKQLIPKESILFSGVSSKPESHSPLLQRLRSGHVDRKPFLGAYLSVCCNSPSHPQRCLLPSR